MSLLKFFYFVSIYCVQLQAAVHDDVPQCGLSGVYKTRQSLLQSPNYPNNYPPDTCWDYIVRSPYRCPTKFHIQFLAFSLESSDNCTNDYLAIGLNNDGDDMDILCGQVIGIKKYHTPDGILRLRFLADDSPWTTSKGFKLLVTRLACERPDVLREIYDDTEEVEAPNASLTLPQSNDLDFLRNLSLQDQHQLYQPPALQLATTIYPGLAYLPQFGALDSPSGRPCSTSQPIDLLYRQQANVGIPPPVADFTEQYLRSNSKAPVEDQARQNTGVGVLPVPERCCISAFQQQRFYLTSPGFPKTVLTALLPTQRRDCLFQLEKYTERVCRLRIEFKFFDFGQTYPGNGISPGNLNIAIGTTRDICAEDYLEVDGERFCGCRTGYAYTSPWPVGEKLIRMRMGYSGIPSNGFLLEISQEECDVTAITPQPNAPNNGVSSLGGLNIPLPNNLPIYPMYGVQRPTYQPGLINWQNYQPVAQVPWPIGVQQTRLPIYRPYRMAKFQKLEMQQQPTTVVETNSTRKEYYYFDGDKDSQWAQARSGTSQPNTEDANKKNQNIIASTRNRCVFSTSDIFKLFVDPLWMRKPTCYAPQQNWFSNIFG